MAGRAADDELVAIAEVKKNEFLDEKDHGILDGSEQQSDGIHDGLELPTEEELATLRRTTDAIPWNMYRELHPSICCRSF